MKFLVSTKHCDSYDWNQFVNYVKSFIIIISQIDVFQSDNHKYVVK
jgi:hypothetical protein